MPGGSLPFFIPTDPTAPIHHTESGAVGAFILFKPTLKMKTTAFAFLLASILFLGCNNTSKDHESGTHTHADGSTHADHAEADTTRQEEFSVGSDSTASARPHTHQDGEKHDHPHGDDHKPE